VSACLAVILIVACAHAVGGGEPVGPNLGLGGLVVLVLVFLGFGLYSDTGPSPYERFRLRVFAIATLAALDFVIGLSTRQLWPEIALHGCLFIALVVVGHYFEALVRTILIRGNMWGAPTALVGVGDRSRDLVDLLTRQPELGLRPIGIFAPCEGGGMSVRFEAAGAVAKRAELAEPPEVAIFSSADAFCTLAPVVQFSNPPCRLMFVDDAHDVQNLWLRTRMLGDAIGIEVRRGPSRRLNRILKRSVDLVIALPLALLSLPIVAALALAVTLVDRGPGLVVLERVGYRGTKLRLFKLRSMYRDADRRLETLLSHNSQARDQWQRFFKLHRDPRVLPFVGSFIRRSSLDELPQLWNVIRGDMSLVGPRPFPYYHSKCFDPKFQEARVSVLPGITGMWQVSSRSNGNLEMQRSQDLFYIRNWSIWLDAFLLLQTVPAVLSASGAK
jgi:lipopolysaccharide/colanic/teichoic acid biosynthesis glycosyltransferase